MKKSVIIFAMVFGSFLLGSLPVAAMDLGVRPIIPENQRGGQNSYFDLVLEPGQKQTLYLELVNHALEEKTFLIEVATAITDGGGTVSYQQRSDDFSDDTVKYPLENLVTAPNEITIEPEGKIAVPIEIKMTYDHFTGIIAGGISVREKSNVLEINEDASVSIINEYSYSVAVLLRQSEEVVNPELKLNRVHPNQRNFKNVICANLQNTEAMYVNEMEIMAQVKKGKDSQPLFEKRTTNLQMAPNSNFDFIVPLEGEPFVPGDYVLNLEVKANNGHWMFQREFTISKEDATNYNQTDMTIPRIPHRLIILVGILVLVIVVLFMIIFKKKKK